MTEHNLNPLADEYGRIKAQIADLELRQKTIKDTFEKAGVVELEGDLFRCVLSNIAENVGPDWKAIAQKMNPSRQLVAAHQKTLKAAHTRVSVSARTGTKVVAA